MDLDPDEPVDVCEVGSPFEAESIAASLRESGFHAVANTIVASNLQWMGGVNNNGTVLVPRRELDAARAALDTLKMAAASIDWDEADQEPAPEQATPHCSYCGSPREDLNATDACSVCGRLPPDRDEKRVQLALWLAAAVFGLPLLTLILLQIAKGLLRR